MAHTCGVCGHAARRIAPDLEGSWERIENHFKLARRVNKNYSHDLRSWKRSTKARKQWARHPQRLAA